MGDDFSQQRAVNAARLVLVTGGCRSGKSSFAQRYVEELGGPRLFLATCPVLDPEMEDRVRRHREERRGRGWDTIEEEVGIAAAVAAAPPHAAILVDCLTLWVNNLVFRADNAGSAFGEDEAAARAREFADACRSRPGLTLAVTNEVGMGIVPDNPLARRYRDMAGRVNQTIAAAADEAYLLVCGLPTRIK